MNASLSIKTYHITNVIENPPKILNVQKRFHKHFLLHIIKY